MKKYFVVSDIHSFYYLLRETLDNKGFDLNNPDHYLILCGDLFDRGLEAKQLLEFVQSLDDRFIYVRGNHEDLLRDCANEILMGLTLSDHHFSNGTVDTICQLTGTKIADLKCRRSEEFDKEVYDKLKPVLDWIEHKSVNYFELKNYVFVHGWIPTYCDSQIGDYIPENWRELPECVWKEVTRWTNGMEAWKWGLRLEDKTIVCGHWHCSWGWSHIDQSRKEFPPKNRVGWQKSFEPYIKKGIIAIDACTAYSGIVNCIVIEEE